MSIAKKVALGCVLMPVVLIGGCFGKMSYDSAMYNLPGEVLKSSLQPTQKLETAMQVAEQLDSYVQPRFEILRDKNFGAFRIRHRNHAGIVQLKVDTPLEKEKIANANAANRDYAINLLHCAEVPYYTYSDSRFVKKPRLDLLYYNQQANLDSWEYSGGSTKMAEDNQLKLEPILSIALKALPQLRAGKEHRTSDAKWDTLMRPVLASKQECLSCHKSVKLGDTLGVMVYAVRNAKRNESTKLSLR